MRVLFLKAIIRATGAGGLFDKDVDIGGYTRKDGTYIAPHRGKRKVSLENVTKPPVQAGTPDLFSPKPPAPAQSSLDFSSRTPSSPDKAPERPLTEAAWMSAIWDAMQRRFDAGESVGYATSLKRWQVTPKNRDHFRFHQGRIESFNNGAWTSLGSSGQAIDSLATWLGLPSSFARMSAELDARTPEDLAAEDARVAAGKAAILPLARDAERLRRASNDDVSSHEKERAYHEARDRMFAEGKRLGLARSDVDDVFDTAEPAAPEPEPEAEAEAELPTGKTAAALLERLARNPLGTVTVTTGGGRKPYTGGKIRPYGGRELKAAQALVKDGVLEFVRTQRDTESAGGWTTYYADHTFKLASQPASQPAPAPARAVPDYPEPAPNPAPDAGLTNQAPELIEWGVPKGTKPAARKRMNKAALKILADKTDGEMTPEDRQALARYTGRGGIGDSLNEFYTRPDVAAAMWTLLRSHGFAGGEVLEPSCGTGVFLHTAPADTKVVGVEMDPTSSRIATILHPGHELSSSSLERFATQDGRTFDAVIGNPPFGPRGGTIADDKPDIAYAENYFLAAALDKTRDGGLVAMVVPTGVMDSSGRRGLRRDLMCQAELVGAHRLPNTAFAEAHTEVTTDVVLFRKRPQAIAGALGALTEQQLRAIGVWDEDFVSGSYFTSGRGAGNILGSLEEGWRSKAGMGHDITVTGSMTGVADELAAWHAPSATVAPSPDMPEILAAVGDDDAARRRVLSASIKPPYQKVELGDIRVIGGVRCVLEGDPPRWHALEEPEKESVLAALPVAEQLDDLMQGRVKDPALGRATLIEALDDYVTAHGVPSLNRDLAAWLGSPSLPRSDGAEPGEHARMVDQARRRVAALLGAVGRDGVYSDLVTGQTRTGEGLTLDTAATQLSLETGGFTTAQLAALTGKPEEEILEHLFASPNYAVDADGEHWTTLDDYLTGELWPKYDAIALQAEHTGLAEPYRAKYRAQLEALERTIAPQALEDVELTFRSGFLTPEMLSGFFADLDRQYKEENPGSAYSPGRVRIEFSDGAWSFVGIDTHLSHDARLVEKYLNRDGARRDDMPRIELLEAKLKTWALQSDFRDDIETAYNRSYRGFRQREFSNAPLEIPGLTTAPGFDLNAYHFSSLRWALETGKGIIAADVGLGKTVRGLALAKLAKASGRAKRPTFVVPKSVLANWTASADLWFPGSKYLVIGETTTVDKHGKSRTTSDNEETRRRKFQEMRQNDYDFVFISQPAWNDLDISPEMRERYVDDDFWVKRAESLGKDPSSKKLNQQKTAHDQAHAKRQFRDREETVYFDDLGVDMLIADEAHAFKNLVSPRQRFGNTPKFLGGSGESKRALDTAFKTRLLREQNGGKGVYFLTATPTKNSPLEVYSMLQHIAPEAFERMGIRNAEDFLDRFCEFENDLILTVDGKLEEALVTSGFKNLDELREVMRRYIERTTAEQVGLKLPTPDPQEHLIDMTAEQEAVYQGLREEAATASNGDGKGASHIFSIMDRMGKASMDLGLLGMKSGPSPKIEACATNVAKLLPRGKQIVFCDTVELHDRVVDELVRAGIPRNKIAVVNAKVAKTGAARQKISDDYNAGKLEVVVGNTATMGEGINLQIGTADIHHLELPWEPASVQQRNGRGLRQGNKNEAVGLHTYLAKGSFDGYRWQTLLAKRDWQDLLWNGGDRVENLAREGAVSRDDMLIMLSPDPVAARAAYEADKEAALKRKTEQDRQSAFSTFERLNRMLGSLVQMKARGDDSAARRRLEGKVYDLRELLARNEHFPHKEALTSDAPALVQPTTGAVWTAGKVFNSETYKYGRPLGDYVVTGVEPETKEILARPKGELHAEPVSFGIDELGAAAPVAGYDPEEETRDFEASLARTALPRQPGQPASQPGERRHLDYEGVRRLPADMVQRNRDHIDRALRAGISSYNVAGSGFPVMDEAGTPSLVSATQIRDAHRLILPHDGRDAFIAGHAAAEAKRDVESHYTQERYGNGRAAGIQARYGYGNDGHRNPWVDATKRVLGAEHVRPVVSAGRQAATQAAHAGIAEAHNMGEAFRAALPALELSQMRADATDAWPKSTVKALRKRAEELGALDAKLHSVLNSRAEKLRTIRGQNWSHGTVGQYLDELTREDAK